MIDKPLGKLITWILGIGFLIAISYVIFIIFFPEIVKSALWTERFLPRTSDKDLISDESLPAEVTDTQNTFMNNLVDHIGQGECLLPLDSLANLGNFNMELSNYEGKITSMIIKQAGDGEQKLHPITAQQDIQVCMINPEAFYNCYLDDNKICNRIPYIVPDLVQISQDKIFVGKEIEQEKEYGLGQGYMFKPENNKICFIPIDRGFGGCSSSDKGLDEDCLNDIRYAIPLCGGPIDNLQLCQIMYQCAETENVEIDAPKQRCTQDNPTIRILNTEEDCDKVKECSNQIISQYGINSQSRCSKIQNAIYSLSFPSIS